MKTPDALRALARICETFPQVPLGVAILGSRRIAFSGANAVLARCYGPGWVEIRGDEAAIACALAAAVCQSGSLPDWQPDWQPS